MVQCIPETYSALVTVIITTYNRAHVLRRAINSVLAQTYKNIQIVIVDDGSTDATDILLGEYADPRIEVLRHPQNRGVLAAKNTGLSHIRGEWFTLLDSDDQMDPDAIEVLLNVPRCVDASIDAVTCNLRDSRTGEFIGKGLAEDQYLDAKTICQKCSGDFCGLTKTSLLGELRFNEKLHGHEDTLWYKINARAKRYYIHKQLFTCDTGGADKITTVSFSKKYLQRDRLLGVYSALANEKEYLECLGKFNPQKASWRLLQGLIVMTASGDTTAAKVYSELMRRSDFKLNRIARLVATALRVGGPIAGRIFLYFLIKAKLLKGYFKK